LKPEALAMPLRGPARPARREPVIMIDDCAAISAGSRPVCIVDDDEAVRDSLGILLQAFGFGVVSHASGAELLADTGRLLRGCLIVDQHMPQMDGLTVLAALRCEGSQVPAILITGRRDAAISRRAQMLEVVAVLEKPFQTALLVKLIQASMRSAP
jgi:two-component system response regulator FixJ